MKAKHEKLKMAVQDIELQFSGHVVKVNKINDIVQRHMQQWLSGQQALLLSILSQINEQFQYFRDQLKKIADLMLVATQRSEPYSVVSMTSVLKEFLTYK